MWVKLKIIRRSISVVEPEQPLDIKAGYTFAQRKRSKSIPSLGIV